MKFNHSTPDQFGRHMRDIYRDAKGEEAAKIAAWLITRSNAELEAWFGVPIGQAGALRGRLTSAVAAHTGLRNLKGE